jgi:uncharacterized cupredoxin-like copper-binding protein
VSNEGPTTHELVVVRTELPAEGLPISADGLTVDEEGVEEVDELHGLDDGTTDRLVVRLTPGPYVFFCNFEGHYLAGMRAEVEVTERA